MAGSAVLSLERQHQILARACLAEMRAQTEATTGEAAVDALAAEGMAKLRSARLRALDAGADSPPFFARIDLDPKAVPESADVESADVESADVESAEGDGSEVFHLGRRHIRDAQGEPVVIDWRVPIARTFYQATAGDRMGLRLRRRFGFSAGDLTSYEDERLDQGESLGLASDLLREEIERPRVGPMRDIVATIQPDQDDLVRADFDDSLCIQGAPGTGKTAVGLHRAAYLFYTFPARLRRTGVLVVGPNAAFLHYVAQVLPTLGENGVAQTTLEELVRHSHPGGPERVPAAEAAELATLKGDPRMAALLERAVRSHVNKPLDDVVVVAHGRRIRVSAGRLRRFVDDVRRAGVRWPVARERLHHQIAADARRQYEDVGGSLTDNETARIARSPAVRAFVDEHWPELSAPALLARIYTDRDFRQRCAGDSLTDAELDSLRWATTPRSWKTAPWTLADLVLLDELVGEVTGVATYNHVILDEAQDLSAMQCRAVGRRCPVGSVTVLGDLAQATTPWAPGDWSATLRHLGHPTATIRPLTAGYRVPQAILDLANRLLPHIAPGVPPATSMRSGRHGLAYAARGELAATVTALSGEDGSLGIIVPDADVRLVLGELSAAGIATGELDAEQDRAITVVPASATKGLEYDHVVVLEPSRIVGGEPRREDGLRRLYLALTRAVSRLVVVHADPLPVELSV